ncbi:MAG: lytic transglycosylase domain-containing protein [Candidatus Gastranaerophilaceae bacterium]
MAIDWVGLRRLCAEEMQKAWNLVFGSAQKPNDAAVTNTSIFAWASTEENKAEDKLSITKKSASDDFDPSKAENVELLLKPPAMTVINLDAILKDAVKEAEKPTTNGTEAVKKKKEKTTANEPILKYEPGVKPFLNTIKRKAAKYGVDWRLIVAMVKHESNFDPKAGSSAGARGLMQLMPETAKDLGCMDPTDPEANLEAGIKYIAQQLKNFNGDIKLALAAYNAGPGNVRHHGGVPPFPETQNYVSKIFQRFRELLLKVPK